MSYKYNGISLHYLKTVQFEAVQERDPTNTDSLWTKYTIRVRGFLSQSESQLHVNLSNSTRTSAAVLAVVKASLETPRRPLTYKIGDTTIVTCPTGLDAKLGPEPLPCTVREVTTGVFFVECGVIVRLVECPYECPTGQVRSPVISLRWTQTESFDENWYSRLNTNGRLIVRSDLLKNADSFRQLTVPPILSDYRRLSSSYTLSPDGLELEFDYVDQEEDRLPPFPATVFEGSYTVHIERPGFKRIGTVQIGLEGQKGTSRKVLLIRAIRMAYNKLEADELLKDPKKGNVPIIWGEFREDLKSPKVQVSMSGMMTHLGKTTVEAAGGTTGEKIGSALFDLSVVPIVSLTIKLHDAIDELLHPGAPGVGAGLGAAGVAGAGGALGVGGPGAVPIVGGAPIGPGGVGAGAGALGVAAVGVAAHVLPDGAFLPPGTSLEALEALPAPKVMPSVGGGIPELSSGRRGIAPPDRKRIAGLLVALFRDPCLCTETVNKDTTSASPPVFGGTLPSLLTSPFSVPPASIVVAPLPPVVDTLVLKDDAVYDTWECETTTTFDTGNVLMPGTGVGSSGHIAAQVSACGPVMKMITTWVAGRTGAPPVLPAFDPTDPNIVPLSGNIVAKEIVTSADGGEPQYLMAGYYVHGVLNPTKYQLVPGVAPFYGKLMDQAAAAAFKYWELPLKQATATGEVGSASGANPFVDNGIVPNQTPVLPAGFENSQALSNPADFNQDALRPPGQTLTQPAGTGSGGYQGFYYVPPVRP